jgi:hypothetical protein
MSRDVINVTRDATREQMLSNHVLELLVIERSEEDVCRQRLPCTAAKITRHTSHTVYQTSRASSPVMPLIMKSLPA